MILLKTLQICGFVKCLFLSPFSSLEVKLLVTTQAGLPFLFSSPCLPGALQTAFFL